MSRCDECRWWRKNPRTVLAGECRRMPPAPADDIAAPRYWPSTKRDDWCGEFCSTRTETPNVPRPGGMNIK